MGRARDIRIMNKREIKNTLAGSLRMGSSISIACQDAGISRGTYYKWLEGDVHFRQAITWAKRARVHLVEDALYKSALSGDVSAQKYFLSNRDPENWKEKANLINNGIIQGGNKALPIHIEVIGVDPEPETEDPDPRQSVEGVVVEEQTI